MTEPPAGFLSAAVAVAHAMRKWQLPVERARLLVDQARRASSVLTARYDARGHLVEVPIEQRRDADFDVANGELFLPGAAEPAVAPVRFTLDIIEPPQAAAAAARPSPGERVQPVTYRLDGETYIDWEATRQRQRGAEGLPWPPLSEESGLQQADEDTVRFRMESAAGALDYSPAAPPAPVGTPIYFCTEDFDRFGEINLIRPRMSATPAAPPVISSVAPAPADSKPAPMSAGRTPEYDQRMAWELACARIDRDGPARKSTLVAEIHAELCQRFSDPPSERTVYRWIAKWWEELEGRARWQIPENGK